jgi:hypothetical protein
MEEPQTAPRSSERVVFAIAALLSVPTLHWLLWRFIIPAAAAPSAATAFLARKSGPAFLKGVIGFGYVQVTMYALDLAGYLPVSSGRRLGFLVMGLCLVALGTAGRLRAAFAAVAADRPENAKTSLTGGEGAPAP